jgi:hypothetical protein
VFYAIINNSNTFQEFVRYYCELRTVKQLSERCIHQDSNDAFETNIKYILKTKCIYIVDSVPLVEIKKCCNYVQSQTDSIDKISLFNVYINVPFY